MIKVKRIIASLYIYVFMVIISSMVSAYNDFYENVLFYGIAYIASFLFATSAIYLLNTVTND